MRRLFLKTTFQCLCSSDFYHVFETSIDNGFHLKVIHAIPQIAQHVYGRVVAMNTNNQGKAQKANQAFTIIVASRSGKYVDRGAL